MKKATIIISAIVLLAVAGHSCGEGSGWRAVEIDGDERCDSLHSVSAEGGVLECRPWMEGDTLVVHISGFNLGWAAITLKIHGGAFRAELGGVPFHTAEAPSFETKSQRLWLGKESYAQGDTLCARFEMRFRVAYPRTGEAEDRDFQGTLCEVIRPKDFDPFAVESFMTFDLPTALHEMGEPLDRYSLDMTGLPEFRVELLNFFPPSPEILIEELTWDTSPTREISDEGKERLTVWYARPIDRRYFRDNGYHSLPELWNGAAQDTLQWLPVHYLEHTTDMQF